MRGQRPIPEKIEQAHVVQLLRSLGWAVYVIGHPSPADGRTFRGTGQTPGMADLEAHSPGHSIRGPELVKIEVKAKGGKLRSEQVTYQQLCERSMVAHIVGGLDAVIAWLMAAGYLTSDRVPYYRLPLDNSDKRV